MANLSPPHRSGSREGGAERPEEVVQQRAVRAGLQPGPFRRLWIALGLSSFGDWLGLLATTALASSWAAATPVRRMRSVACWRCG